MRPTVCLAVVISLLLPVAAFAQIAPAPVAVEAPPAPPEAELPPQIAQQKALFMQMGMDEETATLFSVLSSGQGGDMSQLLPLIMMMRGEKDMGDGLGMMLFMKALSGAGAGATPQPVWFRDGEWLFILESGVLYKINTEAMELEGQVAYKQGGGSSSAALMAILAPVLARAREKARAASCLSNMKQLCLAMLMYAQDYDEVFPKKTWAQDTLPYCRNGAMYVCPSRPELRVGYAMNEKLVLARLGRIRRPAETILLFESNIGGESPVGGPDDVPEGGVHNGGVVAGFADGHAKWLRVGEAKRILAQEAF